MGILSPGPLELSWGPWGSVPWLRPRPTFEVSPFGTLLLAGHCPLLCSVPVWGHCLLVLGDSSQQDSVPGSPALSPALQAMSLTRALSLAAVHGQLLSPSHPNAERCHQGHVPEALGTVPAQGCPQGCPQVLGCCSCSELCPQVFGDTGDVSPGLSPCCLWGTVPTQDLVPGHHCPCPLFSGALPQGLGCCSCIFGMLSPPHWDLVPCSLGPFLGTLGPHSH